MRTVPKAYGLRHMMVASAGLIMKVGDSSDLCTTLRISSACRPMLLGRLRKIPWATSGWVLTPMGLTFGLPKIVKQTSRASIASIPQTAWPATLFMEWWEIRWDMSGLVATRDLAVMALRLTSKGFRSQILATSPLRTACQITSSTLALPCDLAKVDCYLVVPAALSRFTRLSCQQTVLVQTFC